jgi:tRNA-splicing ligase RtcB
MIAAKSLMALGYTPGKALGLALDAAQTGFSMQNEAQVLNTLKKLLRQPEQFTEDEVLAPVAFALLEEIRVDAAARAVIALRPPTEDYRVFGAEYIEPGAAKQMEVAMRLPVTTAGALMPDAHQGYGLPIGGVLAVRNAVIPYGVGVDIGCRMALTVYDIPEGHFFDNRSFYKRELIANTVFGAGNGFKGSERAYHAVLECKEFDRIPFLRGLKDKAFTQLGSSGGGNHFVEWGIIDFEAGDAALGVPKGRYLALLSHSGSRGLGATIAGHYTKLAKELCKLPQEAANLAYLDLNTEAGQEYWAAMHVAGDYASACHEVIHKKLTKAIGGTVLARVENHHNFAWEEEVEGNKVIVHRKGATPAGAGVLGIIPGSMTAPGFLVRGKGNPASLNSAAHGAGRQMSRTQAVKNVSRAALKEILQEKGVTLIGGGLDEAPMAYKDIHKVMEAQSDLVDVVARFMPRMVRMADDGSKED